MSADTPRPDAAEPVDAEFEPAPDSSGAGPKSKAKKSKPANKKTRGPPPQPSAAAQDLEGQVKAFEERVLGLSAQEEKNLPARLRKR